MSYFSRFPLLGYTLDNNATYQVVSDVIKRVAVSQKTKENLVLFDDYDIRDGETPEIVSYKFYDSTDYHWVILLVNDIFDARFGWPLTDAQLFKYVQDKYGESNVGATHHYTLNQNSDIIVDPTVNVPVKTLNITYNITYNIPENIGTLVEYAANGTPTATTSMSSKEATIVSLLQQPTSKQLRSINTSSFANTLHRGDINHSFVTDSTTPLNRRSITSADSIAMLNIHAGREQRLGDNLYNQHVAYYIIKPIVESGNVQLLSNVQVGGNIGNTSAYFDGTNHYTIVGGDHWAFEYARLSVNIASSPLGAFLRQPVQTHYLYGDITGTTFLSGDKDRLGTDANLLVLYREGMIDNSNVHYANIISLIDYLASNVQANVSNVLLPNAIVSNVSVATTSTNTTYVYPYANAYAVSNLAYEEEKNEAKRRIRVLKAEYLNAFITEFQSLINA